MKTITKYIYNQVAANQLPHNEAKTMLKELQDLAANTENDIAVIGMACRFPKASNPDEFWRNLTGGINCIDDFPADRGQSCRELSDQSLIARILGGNPSEHKTDELSIYVKGGYIQEIDKFDAAFFRITPKEAKFMDPLQRMFLETAYEAMEDAGYGGQTLYGAKVGVFVGKDHTNSTMYKYVTEPDEMQLTGSWTGILASRISYIYNFRGPSMVIDTACSSGLVALHEACRALNKNECEMAIAGGIHVQIFADPKGAQRTMEMVESSDEHVRTFDKDASGTVWGEGSGALIMKPLSKAIADGDHIYAVIKGSAINNDGASNGITAPNADAQKELITRAWKEANIDPETISYIEAHGTGTNLGDPIEIKGITSAFEEFTTKKQFCGIGSVKTNVGHLVAAAGLASVIKVILALKHKEIPPSINFESPNPYINFLNSPVYVNDRYRPWNSTDGSPRRAGVSAFGFSGTNCHVILEELPAGPNKEALPAQNQLGILTLSARNKNVLQQLLKRYYDFLEQNKEAAFGDICYTANTGRGHYNYRIALIVADLKDLKQKISRLSGTDPETIQEPGIYFGVYKIVPDHKTGPVENELTENERRQLSTAANQKVNEHWVSGTAILPESAAELCRLYIKGAEIAWDKIYQNQGFSKVSLPVYPLERIKCWAEPNTIEIQGLQIDSQPIHPLLHKLLADSLDQKIYVTGFSVDNQWVLNEHRVLNHYIAPGTTYLEMARAASRAYYEDDPIELRDFMFIQPLLVESGEEKEVQTIVKKGPEYLDFTVASKTVNSMGDEHWAVHAQGKVYPVKPGEISRYNLAELKAKLDGNQINITGNSGNQNFTFGPRWNNIIFGACENDQALIQLQLPEEFKDDLLEYAIHPALMDQAADAFSQSIEGMRLPLMYKKMTIYGPMPANFYCYLRRKDKGTGNLETIVLDATLMDESGQIFIEIEDYSLKRVKDGELKFTKPADETFYYGFTWQPAELSMEAPATENGCVLVFKDKRGIADRIIQGLKAKGWDLVEVEIGSGYEQVTANQYRIQGGEADYQNLMIALHDKKISKILHFMSIDNGNPPEASSGASLADLEEKLKKGIYSLFYLSRELSKRNDMHGIDLVLIGDNVNEVTKDEDYLNPASGSFFGMRKAVCFENLKIKCRAIDIDHHTELDKIIVEILAPGSTYQVAYRQNQRFIEEFQIIELQNESDSAIKDGGVYIITGGTGGVGLKIGKYLAGKAKLKLALINRTAIPRRELWDEIVARNEDKKLIAKIAAIREIEQAGSEVLIFSADICNEISLKPVLDELRHKYGRFNGIIHAAGVAGTEFMIKKSIRRFQEVISPKIQGTWLLDKLTASDSLDFFIIFSSIITIFGGAGQSDYIAANSYLDSFAAYRNKQGKRTICINWPLWEGVGMATANIITEDKLTFKGVSQTKALAIFEDILTRVEAPGSRLSRVIFGELNYKMIAAFEEDLPFQLSERLNTALKKQKTRLTDNKATLKARNFQKASIIGIGNQDEEQTAYIMAQIWAMVLGLSEIDVHQNFYDLGGDSILASQLFREIDCKYPELLSISDIFSYPTVSALAEYIDANGGLPKTEKSSVAAPENLAADSPLDFGLELGDDTDDIQNNNSPNPINPEMDSTDYKLSQMNPFYDLKDYQPFEIAQAGTKVLRIKSQNEITTYLSHALPLCVILTDPKLIPWYYEHFIDIYSITDENDYLKVDFLEYRAAYKEVMYEVYLGYNLLQKEPDIIQFIMDKIDQGYYVIIHADEYYLPVKRWYRKEHFVHHSIIYGYDHGNKKLLAIGFDMEQIFTQITFDYDIFAEAYEQGKIHYKESAPWAENNAVELLKLKDYQEEYPFDIKRFLGKLDGYLSSTGDDTVIFSYNWKQKNDKVTYGLDVYQQIIKRLENFLEGKFTIDYRAIHLLYEHKKSIENRLRYILDRYRTSENLEKMVRDYSRIVEEMEPIRRKFMEQNYALNSQKLNLSHFSNVVKESVAAIRSIKEKEEKILTGICHRIQHELL